MEADEYVAKMAGIGVYIPPYKTNTNMYDTIFERIENCVEYYKPVFMRAGLNDDLGHKIWHKYKFWEYFNVESVIKKLEKIGS